MVHQNNRKTTIPVPNQTINNTRQKQHNKQKQTNRNQHTNGGLRTVQSNERKKNNNYKPLRKTIQTRNGNNHEILEQHKTPAINRRNENKHTIHRWWRNKKPTKQQQHDKRTNSRHNNS